MTPTILTIVACLNAAPSDCVEERVPFDGSMMACALHGQQYVAQWVATHPRRTVKRWACGPDREGV